MPSDPITRYVQWMRTKGLSTSLIARRSSVLRAAEYQMGVGLLKASPEDVTRFLAAEQKRGLSDATRHIYAGHLRTFYSWAIRAGLSRRNPVIGAAVPKRPRYLPRPIADQQLHRAFTAAEPRTRLILALASMAGLRAVEIARLRREDIIDHGDEPSILVHGKGDKPRMVSLSPQLLAELLRYGMPKRGPIIRRLDDGKHPVSPSLISSVANRHLHELGISDTLHSCRHWSATSLYRDTRDIRLVQETLGHSSPAVTAIYVAYSSEKAPAAMERLGVRLLAPIEAPAT